MGLCAGKDLMLVGLNAMLMLLCFLFNRKAILAVWFAILMVLSWLQSVIVLLAVLGLEKKKRLVFGRHIVG